MTRSYTPILPVAAGDPRPASRGEPHHPRRRASSSSPEAPRPGALRAFADDRGLLPPETLQGVSRTSPYNPTRMGEPSRSLPAHRRRNGRSRIPGYTAACFARDHLLDRLAFLTRCSAAFRRLGDFQLSLPAEVVGGSGCPPRDVEILGHIFEQSITDLDGSEGACRGSFRRRPRGAARREGAFYTPRVLTSLFIVGALPAPRSRDRFESLREPSITSTRATRSNAGGPAIYDPQASTSPNATPLIRFWDAGPDSSSAFGF